MWRGMATDVACLPHDDVIKWKHALCYWHLCGEFTGHRWTPRTKTSDVELWWFLWSAPEKNGLVSNDEAVDFRRHRAHYDAIVVFCRETWNSITDPTNAFTEFHTRLTKCVSHCCDTVMMASAWWRQDMETCSTLLTLYVENPLVISGLPSQRANNADWLIDHLYFRHRWRCTDI